MNLFLFLWTQSQYLYYADQKTRWSDQFDVDWEKNFLKNIYIFEYKHM